MAARRNTKAKETRAFARGVTAYRTNKRLMDCPYRTEKTAKQWALGWVEGMRRHSL
jgi:ribosome modulation factor